jgi:hypothetical protein
LVNLLLCYEPFPTGVKQRDQPATIDFAMAALNSDINIWKEVPDTFISVTQGCQARKGSSCDQACLTSLRHEVGTISRLERSAIKSTLAQEKYFDRDLGPKLFVIDRCVSQSHVLESYIHSEMTEVCTLLSLGALRVTGVGYIPISDGVGQKRRDLDGMAWSALHQGYLRGFTAASHVDTHCLQLFCPMGTDGEFFTPFGIAVDYLHRDLTRNSRMPYLAERRNQLHPLHSPHLLAEVTFVSCQEDLLVV